MPQGWARALPSQLGLIWVAVPPPLKLPGAPRFSCHLVMTPFPVLATYTIEGLVGSTAIPRGALIRLPVVPQPPTTSSSALVPLGTDRSWASSNTCSRQPPTSVAYTRPPCTRMPCTPPENMPGDLPWDPKRCTNPPFWVKAITSLLLSPTQM